MPRRTWLSSILLASLCACILHAQTTPPAAGESWEQSVLRGQQLVNLGDYAGAEEILRKALQEAGGGVLYARLGRPDRAERDLKRALAIGESALGPAHFAVAGILSNYAAVLRRLKLSSKAERLDQRAKLILKQSAATALLDHTVSVSNLRKSKGRP